MRVIALSCILSFIVFSSPAIADAHGPEGHKNLKVVPEENEAELKDGMKELAKGLGVKCTACHVPKKFDSERKPEKLEAREFLKAVWNETSPAPRDAALSKLLAVLKLEQAKDPKLVWAAIARLGGKPSAAVEPVPDAPPVEATAKAPEPVEPPPPTPAPKANPPAPAEQEDSSTCHSVGKPSFAVFVAALLALLVIRRGRNR